MPLRAICDRVGVKLPTLYHFFGSKDGLLEAVIDYGFASYLQLKEAAEPTGDPIEDIRRGWDTHVKFGLDNAGFYALMYGQVTPHRRPAAAALPHAALLELCRDAQTQGRLAVPAAQAADQVLAANIGVTLFLITSEAPDLELSAGVREATLAAITGLSDPRRATPDARPELARRLLHALSDADVDEAFARAASGRPAILSCFDHDYRDIAERIDDLREVFVTLHRQGLHVAAGDPWPFDGPQSRAAIGTSAAPLPRRTPTSSNTLSSARVMP